MKMRLQEAKQILKKAGYLLKEARADLNDEGTFDVDLDDTLPSDADLTDADFKKFQDDVITILIEKYGFDPNPKFAEELVTAKKHYANYVQEKYNDGKTAFSVAAGIYRLYMNKWC